MLEALGLAQGTWAAVSLRKKSLQIRYATEGPWWADSSPELSAHKRFDRRVGIGAAIGAILLLFLVADHFLSRTAAANSPQTSRPFTPKVPETPPTSAELQFDFQLKTLEVRIDIEKEHAASLEKQMGALHQEAESLKEARARGARVDSKTLNVKLYEYANLHRESRGVWAVINQLVAQRRLLLKQLSRDGENTQ
jgi:hypothetical protein